MNTIINAKTNNQLDVQTQKEMQMQINDFEFDIILKEMTIKLKKYLKNLQKNDDLIDLVQIISNAYFICKNTEYKHFNIQDLSIELLNNICNEKKNYDIIISIFVELVNQEIIKNENASTILQNNHKKLENIVYKNFCSIYFNENMELNDKKDLIIMNSLNEYNSFDLSYD